MTRAKEITKEAKKFAKEIDDWEIAEDVQDAFEQGAQWADRSMIDKACEWLRNNWHKYINIDADGVVCFGHWENDFRKAMRGE